MKKAFLMVLVALFCMALVGCASGQTSADVDIPDFTLVDSNDVSIPGTTRMTYWVAVDEQIDSSGAEAVAKAVAADDKDIDEVTVWIYDSVDAAKNGMITNKMYDVILSKGKVTDTIQNELYDFE